VKRPTSVVIGGLNWRISFQDSHIAHPHGTAMGTTDPEAQEIIVSTMQHDDQQRRVLLHEMLHACYHVAGHRDADELSLSEEMAISRVETSLFVALRDNPEVIKWLIGE
jgi:hypothetical protein